MGWFLSRAFANGALGAFWRVERARRPPGNLEQLAIRNGSLSLYVAPIKCRRLDQGAGPEYDSSRLNSPGDVWCQSLPFSRLAGRVLANASSLGKGEGSLLGGLGDMLMGDND